MTETRKLEISLVTMRLSIGVFFLIWAIQKTVAPELAQRVFETFYFSSPSPTYLIVTGVVQLAIVVAFMAGLFRTWTGGALLAMHTISLLSTYERLANPYESPNALFWAAVPVWAAILTLFLLRKSDRLLSLDAFIAARRNGGVAERA